MAIPSPPSPTRLPLQSHPQSQSRSPKTKTHTHAQKPSLSVDVHGPSSPPQAHSPDAPSMPSSSSKGRPAAPPPTPSPSKKRQLDNRSGNGPEEMPPPPPHSPISPKGIAARLESMKPYNAPNIITKPPPPVPIAESDNVDVIALRSALMILQVQRESARRDIKELQELKEEAYKDPEAYVQELVKRSKAQVQQQEQKQLDDSKTKMTEGGAVKEDLLAPTMRYLVDGLGKESEFLKRRDEPTTNKKSPRKSSAGSKSSGAKQTSASESDSDVSMQDVEQESSNKSKFAAVPKAQNVYRMPPVNWAKYQLSGAGLEKLHHDQQTQPTAGKPSDPAAVVAGIGARPTERYVMAAPYEPVVDAMRMGHPSDHPMQTRRKRDRK